MYINHKHASLIHLIIVFSILHLSSCRDSSSPTTDNGPVSPPAAPTDVSAAAGNGQVTIAWSPVVGATSYNIYWSTMSNVTKTNGTKISGVVTPHIHAGRTNGTTYYYVTTAVNAGGESADSTETSATPIHWTLLKLPDTGQTGDYTTTFGEDSDYTLNAPSFNDNGNGTIADNVTSLMWQKQDDATTRDWTAAGTYCDGLTLGGYSDWRLPNDIELMSIVDYGRFTPAINTTYFPGTQASHYWSSNRVAYYTGNGWSYTLDAWFVGFYNGGVSHDNSFYNTFYVRCVRGGQAAYTSSFTDNGDGTVADDHTGLVWQKQDDATIRTWDAAISYCESLSLGGQNDWRLPNVKELRSIVDNTRNIPSIDTTYFPGTQSSYYWSSTTRADDTAYARDVSFGIGYVSDYYKGFTSNYVRCVRGGK